MRDGEKLLAEEIPVKLSGEIDVFENKKREILSTGDTRLDEFLSLQRGIPIMIAGAAYTGKTTLALSISLDALAKGNKVFYIDSECGVLGNRIIQMCNARNINLSLVKERMKILRISKLEKLSEYLKYASDKYDLVIVDSISRFIMGGMRTDTKSLESLEGLISKAYITLNESIIALSKRNGTLLVINEIIPKAKKDIFYTLTISLTRLAVLTKIIVCLITKRDKRFLYLERHPFKASIYEEPLFVEYRITNKGLEYLGKVHLDKGMIQYHVDIE